LIFGSSDPEVREKITEMVTRVGERLVADDWSILDERGAREVSASG
jgi:hypothetical protein